MSRSAGRGGLGARAWQLLDLAVALAAFGVFAVALGYPWQLATVAGLAVGVLAGLTRRTIVNLWRLYGRDPVLERLDEGSDDPAEEPEP